MIFLLYPANKQEIEDRNDAVIELSKNIGADLVVMSTHGRSGLQHWALGSVAEKVLRYGETPLLLVNVRA